MEKAKRVIQLLFGNSRNGFLNLEVAIIIALAVNLTGVVFSTHRFFKEKMGRMTCDSNMRAITEAIEIYHAYYNIGKNVIEEERVGEVNIRYLVSKDFLQYVPVCPNSGTYKWDSNRELYCTYHGRGEMK